ncbi:fibroblast growth factor receptor [Trichuris trichiura]|uniref:receptor protein-tyrosine kinase n=1 Tax=Trichuris trichiura TaxID=36087 RepID=A0A077Z3G5_TRITR|nr:fibroblast growth factor receptor [Trichuris trichiura]
MNPRFRTHVRPKQEVMLGDRMKLRCEAVGKPQPYVHWYRNNELISPAKSQQRVKFNRFSMTIMRVEPGDEGLYACKVWNQIGQIWRNFTVRINDLAQWKHRMLEHGRMMAQNRNDPSEVKEFLDPEDVNFDRDWNKKGGPRLDDLPQNDGGGHAVDQQLGDWNDSNTTPAWYKQFERDNRQGFSLSSRRDFSLGAPYWSKPESEFVKVVASPAGRQQKLSCRANGEPEPQVIWYKNGVEITPEMERRLGYHIKKWSLILPDLVPSDAGTYTCKVFNKYGEISHNYTVTVVGEFSANWPQRSVVQLVCCSERVPHKPIIAPDFPKNLTVHVGENATFSCPVLSDLQPHIEWFRHKQVNGTWFDQNDYWYGDQINSDASDGSTDQDSASDPYTLVLLNVTMEQSTWYTCVVGNALGVVYKSAWLEVLPGRDAAANDSLSVAKTAQFQWKDTINVILTFLVAIIATIAFICCFIMFRFLSAQRLCRRRRMKPHPQVQCEHATTDSCNGFAPTQKLIKINRDGQYMSNGSLAPLISIVPANVPAEERSNGKDDDDDNDGDDVSDSSSEESDQEVHPMVVQKSEELSQRRTTRARYQPFSRIRSPYLFQCSDRWPAGLSSDLPSVKTSLRPISEVFELELENLHISNSKPCLADSGHSSENSSSPRESCSSDRQSSMQGSNVSVNSSHSAVSSGRGTDGSLAASKEAKKEHKPSAKRHSVPDLSDASLSSEVFTHSSQAQQHTWSGNGRDRPLGSSCNDIFSPRKVASSIAKSKLEAGGEKGKLRAIEDAMSPSQEVLDKSGKKNLNLRKKLSSSQLEEMDPKRYSEKKEDKPSTADANANGHSQVLSSAEPAYLDLLVASRESVV